MVARPRTSFAQAVHPFQTRRLSHWDLYRQGQNWLGNARERAKSLPVHVGLPARTDAWKAKTNAILSQLGLRLNEVTGYQAIDELKRSVVQKGKHRFWIHNPRSSASNHSPIFLVLLGLEQDISQLREKARSAKISYEDAVSTRSTCQRELNDLLQRKSSWSESDVSRFTGLVRQDHINAQAEVTAKQHLDEMERKLETAFDGLMRSILNRYHEEQIWSDKIRSASTYGQLLALGLNLMVFVAAIIIVEPYKRKRLRESLETRIVLLEKENQQLMKEGIKNINNHFAKQEEILSNLAAVAVGHSHESKHTQAIDRLPASLPPTYPSSEVQLPWTEYRMPIHNMHILSAAAGAVGGITITWLLNR